MQSLDLLYHCLGGEHDKKGNIHADCPYCGKPAKRGQTHFSYGAKGFKCFVCDESGNLTKLARDLNLESDFDAPKHLLRPSLEIPTDNEPKRFEEWQAAAAAIIDRLPSANESSAATEFLLSKGYTLETIVARGVKYNSAWEALDYITDDGTPAKIAPGIIYAHYDQHGKPTAVFTRLINPQPNKSKVIQVAGGKPKLGIYGNLDTPNAPVIITAGQKDSDFVFQTFPGAVNSITMGSCNVSLPARATQKIADLNAPFVAIIYDNDPPIEQQHAETHAAKLRIALNCPVLVIPPSNGFKDFADMVAKGGDVDRFWARMVAPVNITLIQLLCSFKRFEWTDKVHGDPAYLAAILIIRHEAIANHYITHDAYLSINQLIELSEMVGHPLTDKAVRKGVELAVKWELWREFNLAQIGHSIESHIYASKFGKVGNNTALYQPLPCFDGFKNLLVHLENEIPTTYDDWASAEPLADYGTSFLEELHRYKIKDMRSATLVDRYDTNGTPYQDMVNETTQLFVELDFLRDTSDLVLHPFIWPDGCTLSNYPNKLETARPNAPKCLRVALLKVLNERNTRQLKLHNGNTVIGWQVSADSLTRILGISKGSVTEYRSAAGLTTLEQKPKIVILGNDNRRQKIEKFIGKRQKGVTIWLGATPTQLTPANRDNLLNGANKSPFPVSVEIQLASIQYAAAPDEIEAIRLERKNRHKARTERAKREQLNDYRPAPKEQMGCAVPDLTDVLDIAESGYSKLFVYYHLLKMLPVLLEASKTSALIAHVLVSYGLSERDLPMPSATFTAEKYELLDEIENEAPPLPLNHTIAEKVGPPIDNPSNHRVNYPEDYPFADEYKRLNRPEYVSHFHKQETP